MEFTKNQKELFKISKAKLSRDMGRELTKPEIKKLVDTINEHFPTDKEADEALKNLATKILLVPEVWDDWMNKGYPPDYEDRKKKQSSKPKRKIIKKKKGCGCK
jgi:hypothetical protein